MFSRGVGGSGGRRQVVSAVVTGGGSGIGLATGRRLAHEGTTVLLVSKSDSAVRAAEQLRQEGLSAMSSQCDVGDHAALAEVYRAAAGESGRIDIAVHAAGVVYPGKVGAFDPSEWEEMTRTNVMGVVNGCNHALGHMREGGLIVNVSSVSGREPSLNAMYSANKHAVTGFTEVLRREVAERGIRVTCLEPGLVSSQLDRHHPADFRNERSSLPSLSGDDIADIVWWLWTLPSQVDVGELLVRHVSQL